MEHIVPKPALAEPGRRKSVFLEVGLEDEEKLRNERRPTPALISARYSTKPRARAVRFRSNTDVFQDKHGEVEENSWESASDLDDDATSPARLQSLQTSTTTSGLFRFGFVAVIVGLMLSVCQMGPVGPLGVRGGAIPRNPVESTDRLQLSRREDTKTDVCTRWAGQSAIVNGTLYMYGFRTSTSPQQDSNTWTNDFLSLDLKKSWQIASPALTGLPKPSGPPAVSLGYLWSSFSSLYLYGGQYSDSPKENPGPNSVWEYNIATSNWIEHKDPKTSGGDNAEGDGQVVQRAAEGAGLSVATLGRGWFFGGHLDDFTTEGWSNQIPRLYLKSLLEFTFPGFSNEAVDSLKGGKTAGENGVYRNVTDGGLQNTGAFPERADSVIVYIPGFGDEGILLGLTGGDNDTYTQMNTIDIYDIAKSKWYKQSTSGTVPKYRVNPCAVVASAADGSSHNVYMYGGQSSQPAKDQTQYDDMWILSIPSFTWIEVDQSKQSVPYARAGHSCHVYDGQMIVLGGYVGKELSCDSPGIYVFNMSSLQWSNQFTALTGDKALQPWDGKDDGSGNPLAQQANQRGYDSKAGLEGSYGYEVPAQVQEVIGGKETGGATLTAPVQSPTEGPFKTGTAQTYTVTSPNGAVRTETVTSGGNGGGRGTNVGAIVAGVIAGLFFIIAAYFAFCAWIYRKQVKIWKEHASMVAARAANNEKSDPFAAQGATVASSTKNSSERAQRDLIGTRSSETTSAMRISDERGASSCTGATGVAAGGSGIGGADALGRRSSNGSSTDDLLAGQEPSFWGANGVLLNPRRSLRVINRD